MRVRFQTRDRIEEVLYKLCLKCCLGTWESGVVTSSHVDVTIEVQKSNLA